MAAGLTSRGKPDRSRIDMNDIYEVRHWTKTFRVTKEQLQRVIDKVGPGVKAVAKEAGYATLVGAGRMMVRSSSPLRMGEAVTEERT